MYVITSLTAYAKVEELPTCLLISHNEFPYYRTIFSPWTVSPQQEVTTPNCFGVPPVKRKNAVWFVGHPVKKTKKTARKNATRWEFGPRVQKSSRVPWGLEWGALGWGPCSPASHRTSWTSPLWDPCSPDRTWWWPAPAEDPLGLLRIDLPCPSPNWTALRLMCRECTSRTPTSPEYSTHLLSSLHCNMLILLISQEFSLCVCVFSSHNVCSKSKGDGVKEA